jgi:hypothetical protein
MTGFLYRRAVGLKELGETLGCDWMTRLGLFLREVIISHGKAK